MKLLIVITFFILMGCASQQPCFDYYMPYWKDNCYWVSICDGLGHCERVSTYCEE